MPDKTFFLTTPIYYINSTPHIGHAYTTLAADARARFERLRGRRVYFLTGTDEHGSKVAQAARERGLSPQEHADDIAAKYRKCWDALSISYDDFIRTTQPRHEDAARRLFSALWDGGYLKLGSYAGWYSVPDETFIRDEDIETRDSQTYIANPSADQSKLPLEYVEEATHFFQLSQFEKPLLDFYTAHPQTLQPEARRNETLSYIASGLRDTSVSRELEWGISLPPDVPESEHHSIYVWFEALMNYATAPGFLSDDETQRARFQEVWPPDLQLMSKDIFTRFHATLWIAMLQAVGLEPPRVLFAHGFWTVDGRKMSKRDAATIVEPVEFAREISERAGCDFNIGVDALRYYCLREVTFGADGDFSREGCLARYNGDLANGLGNLVNRALSMLQQYFESVVPAASTRELGLSAAARAATLEIETAYETLDFSGALVKVWEIVAHGNRLIEEEKPWAKMKSGATEEVAALLNELLFIASWCSTVLSPVMPNVSEKLRDLLALESAVSWTPDELSPGHVCRAPQPLFPRIAPGNLIYDEGKNMENQTSNGETVASLAASPADAISATAAVETPVAPENAESKPDSKAEIQYDDFAKIELRAARVLAAERIPKADKLLKIQVDLGTEQRQILAGIAQQFEPESLIGKTVVVVANLAPRKMRGLDSQGMLLAASATDDSAPSGLVTIDADVPPGSIVR